MKKRSFRVIKELHNRQTIGPNSDEYFFINKISAKKRRWKRREKEKDKNYLNDKNSFKSLTRTEKEVYK